MLQKIAVDSSVAQSACNQVAACGRTLPQLYAAGQTRWLADGLHGVHLASSGRCELKKATRSNLRVHGSSQWQLARASIWRVCTQSACSKCCASTCGTHDGSHSQQQWHELGACSLAPMTTCKAQILLCARFTHHDLMIRYDKALTQARRSTTLLLLLLMTILQGGQAHQSMLRARPELSSQHHFTPCT